jgi:hypothetical protein
MRGKRSRAALIPAPVALSSAPQVAEPYWTDSDERRDAWLRLAGVVALSLGTTGA